MVAAVGAISDRLQEGEGGFEDAGRSEVVADCPVLRVGDGIDVSGD